MLLQTTTSNPTTFGVIMVVIGSLAAIGTAILYKSRPTSVRLGGLIGGLAGFSYLYFVYSGGNTTAAYVTMALLGLMILSVIVYGFERYQTYSRGY
ncbi:hypothetical protein AUR64_14390 [Haloprofundus marisrubri]|uniref:Uncharacterized protein n=1 Tax=Haloprofundus marisrubri TaxID=1514971 RepID=A0A0W1R6S6_9EURY|nr:hypothetical protein AUR64_14390 [Haloprofundus marisrubri]